MTLLQIFGGVALIVFGVRYLRKGLDRLFGKRLGPWLQRLAARRGWSFLAGVGVSVLAPSSTTMSLLAVHTVRSGHLTARQMLTIMLGANIGLTIMVVLIGLDVQEEVAPIIVLLGVILFQFTRASRSRGVGQVLLAVGFIFIAIDIMKRAAIGIEPDAEGGVWEIINFATLENHPVMLALVSAILAMALQSSTATIGLVIGLGSASAISLRFAIPMVIGANVGLSITTVLVGWRLMEPRRLGLCNLLLKCVVAVVGITLIAIFGDRLPSPPAEQFGMVIAMTHTGFNTLVALVGLPSVSLVTNLVERLAPSPPPQSRRAFSPKYINSGPIGGVALAMGLSQREITHMSEIIRGMLRDIWQALKTGDERLCREVAERDDKVDLLDLEIKRFLVRLAKDEVGEYDADEQMRQLRYLNELETIGDIIDKNLSVLVLKKIRLGGDFSKEGAEELEDFYRKVAENVVIAETAFTTRDRILAQQLLRHKQRIDQFEQELRDRHFHRLNEGLTETYENSAIHLDLLTHLKRINASVSHVAFAILQDPRPTDTPPPGGAGE